MFSKNIIGINALMIILLGGCAEIPDHAVIAFNATTCPHDGWQTYKPAQGVFIRGLDLGENPKFARSNPSDKIYADPDHQRALASQQDDQVGPHTHTIRTGFANASAMDQSDGWHGEASQQSSTNVDPKTGLPVVETRPKNVALLYCEKMK